MWHPKANAGFTLIEVLIAMTLLGIMVVLLFSGMRISAQSWQKGEDKINEVNDVAVVYQFFKHHLTAAKPLWKEVTEDNESEFSFQGKSQELQFVSSFPASANKSGLQLFTIKLVKESDDTFIQVSIHPFFPALEGEEWREEEVTLLAHVRNFTLTYFGLDESAPDGIWQEEWLDQESLPRLVKIKIERDDGNFWPEMTIDLKSEAMQANPDDQSLIDGESPSSGVVDDGQGQ